jgi:hypothetical protein
MLQDCRVLDSNLVCLNRRAQAHERHSVRMLTSASMADLIDIRLLIAATLEQARLAQLLSPDLSHIDLLDRTAAAISTLLPRRPDAVLEYAMNEAAQLLNAAPA